MHFRASNPYDYYRPSKCERRVALRHRGAKESPRTEFDDLLARLGARHETDHLHRLSGVKNLEGLDDGSQERETLAAIRAGVPAIYQARFRVSLDQDGGSSDLVGLPDFLIRDGDGYIIRDSKLVRSVEGRHPEIALQLQLYGWLYELVVGKPPVGLQVHSGSGDVIDVPYDCGKTALEFPA
jgi:predicted RecB family nuclease